MDKQLQYTTVRLNNSRAFQELHKKFPPDEGNKVQIHSMTHAESSLFTS